MSVVNFQNSCPSPVFGNAEVEFVSLFKHFPLPAWISDPDTGAFIAVNDAAVRLYGYSRDQFSSMTTQDLDPDGFGWSMKQAKAERNPEPLFEKCKHKKIDGSL